MNEIFTEYKFPNGGVIRNRLIMAPMTTYSSNVDLTLSDEEEIYYNKRSTEFGMVITAAVAVSKNAQAFPNQISIRDERYLDSMTRLANTIKKEGAKAVIQLHHGGRMNLPNQYPNQDIVSASAIKANRDYAVTPRELKTSEVYDVIDDFVRATEIAIKAGFDGVELHGANTYLIQQFVSPNSNRRTDEFGRDRLKFTKTILDRIINVVKYKANPGFIIGYRFSPEELENPGITLEDTMELVEQLSQRKIDYLHVSLGHYKQSSIRDKTDNEPIVLKLKRQIKGRLPLIGVGHIESRNEMEESLDLGYDLLSLGLIALSELHPVSKLQQNKELSKKFNGNLFIPENMVERLKNWNLEKRGYLFSESDKDK